MLTFPSFSAASTGRFNLVRTVLNRQLLLGYLLSFSVMASAQIRYVKETGNNTNPASATSWADATSDLQGAINSLTATGGEVWVAAGTYKPTTTTGPGSRTISFSMRNQVAIYGGFLGSETDLSQRPTINLTTPSSTILSGDIGTPVDKTDNSYHVFYHPEESNLNSTAVLDGVVITDGNADGTGGDRNGGGMYNWGSSPTLTNCRFQSNSGVSNGGGMYNLLDSNPTLTNCSFLSNSTSTSGGGIYNTSSSPALTNCSFQTNSASSTGGGVGCYKSNATLTNCSFLANSASNTGGGILSSISSLTLTNCSFQNNLAIYGGGMYIDNDSSPMLIYCNFRDNATTGRGSGIDNENSTLTLIGCTFQTNSSAYFGAGIFNYRSTANLTNCSFLNNSALVNGGALYNSQSNSVLTNCSFQANSSDKGGAIYNYINSRADMVNCVLFNNGGAYSFVNYGDLGTNSYVTVKYSLLDVPWYGYNYWDSGENRTASVSPFVSTTSTQLNSCALAINAGTNSATALSGITTDLAGNSRFYNGGTVDMGAYEYQGTPSSLTVTNPVVNVATVGQAFSQNYSASGGIAPYSFSVVGGSVPTGLSLSPAGVLSGTPTEEGNFTPILQVKDAGGCSVLSSGYLLTVANSGLSVDGFSATSNSACVGSPVTFTATVGNLTGSFAFTLTNGMSSRTGNITGAAFSRTLTPTQAGAQTFTLTISSNGQTASANYLLTVNASPTVSVNPSSVTVSQGQTAQFVVIASGNGHTYQWQHNTINGFVDLASDATYSGVNSATLSVANTTSGLTGNSYRVMVTKDGCSTPSDSATLTVNELMPDLTMILYTQPSLLYDNATVSLVVDVVELNGKASNGTVTVKITQESNMSLSLPANATTVGGRSVNNSVWSLSGPENGFYVLTTNQGIGASDKLSVGLMGDFVPDATSGLLTVSGVVLLSGDSEQRLTNNTDADKIDYFQK